MYAISRLSADDFHGHVTGLADVLIDAVTGGASLGFVAPFGQREASGWWHAQAAAVADGGLVVWVARHGDRVHGTVSLAFETKANGRHRGYILKLIVHRDARRQGLARRLLAGAEHAAAQAGIARLLLDTETGSEADHLYRAAGWTCYGIVPEYATDPAGSLRDCSFFYKKLG